MSGKNKIGDYVDELAREYPSRKRRVDDSKGHGLSPWPQHDLEVLKQSRPSRLLKNYDSDNSRKEVSLTRKDKRPSPTIGHYSQPRKGTVAGDIVRISPWEFPPAQNRQSLLLPPNQRHATSSGTLLRQPTSTRQRIKTLLEKKLQHPLKSTHILIGERLQTDSMNRASCTLFFFKSKSPGVQQRLKNIKLLREPSYRQELLERLCTDG